MGSLGAPNGQCPRTYTTVALTATAGGSTSVVAAAGAGLRIYVVCVALMGDGVVNVKFVDGAGNLTGLFPLAANTGFVLGPQPACYWFSTAANSALSINLSTAANIGGVVGYFIAT